MIAPSALLGACLNMFGVEMTQVSRSCIKNGRHHAGGPPLPPGISGIAALNSSLGGGVNPNLVNPNVAPVVDPATVPFQEGWVKIRGIPPGTGKKELCAFFSVSPCCHMHKPGAVSPADRLPC